MKNNLENSIKESLENFELPYDASAWSAMSERLDQVKPTTPPTSSGLGKWFVAAGAVATVAVGSYFYFNNDTTTTNTTVSQVETTNTTNDQTTTQTTSESSTTTNGSSHLNDQETTSSDVVTPGQPEENGATTLTNEAASTTSSTTDNSSSSTTTSGNDTNSSSSSSTSSNNSSTTSTDSNKKIIIPEVKDVCLGENVTIKNDNNNEMIIVTPLNDKYTIQANSDLTFKSKQAGEYIVYDRRGVIRDTELTRFTVGDLPKLDFYADEQTQFDNGIPTIPLETTSVGSNFTWSFEGISQKQYGTKAEAHFFKTGRHEVTLTAEGTTGCKTEFTKYVNVTEDYNLFAPTGFIPGDSDPKVSHFMPLALTVRDVQFRLIIIDPKTGNVMFETSNASMGWDGTNKNTGQLVQANTSFVWKVTLNNPEPGERSEYSGTITRL